MSPPATRRSALALCAAALTCGTALSTAPAARAAEKTPAPPATMSTTGGDLLGTPGTQVRPGTDTPALPKKITARSWIVADAESGDVLAAHNAHWELPPASTLKMLFADTVLPNFAKTDKHKVELSDLDGVGAGSSLVGIKENLTYTVHDLWLGVFLRSGNDAVHVLSSMNGGVDKTVVEMQDHADELQANDTRVVSPDGYDMPGQVSSAYDLTLFARAGLQNADFREYCSTVSAKFPGVWKKGKDGKKKRESFEIQNTNRLLSGDTGLSQYEGIAGVKNGNTTEAGATFTGVAQRGDRTLLVTVMHPDTGHNLVYEEAASLLDWGFGAAATTEPVGILVPPRSAEQASGSASPGTADGKGGESGGDGTKPTATGVAGAAAPASGGVWTAAAVAGGSLVLVAAIAFLVRRRWPLPRS